MKDCIKTWTWDGIYFFHLLPADIGCAGEVRVSTHEDFDKWGIDILVKFRLELMKMAQLLSTIMNEYLFIYFINKRDNEKLQLLNGQRQSGGVSKLQNLFNMIITSFPP